MDLEHLIEYLSRRTTFRVVLFLVTASLLVDLSFQNLASVFYHSTAVHFCKSFGNVTETSGLSLNNKTYTNDDSTCTASDGSHDGECNGYNYITGNGEWTVVTEWDLVCDWKFVPPLLTSLYFVGSILGSTFFSHLSDRIGRKPVILICIYVQVAAGLLLFCSPYLWLYTLLRTLVGFVVDPLVIVGFVLLMEYCPTHLRGITGTGYQLFWSIGALIFGGIAYFFRQWRQTQLAITVPFIISCIYLLFIPESIRWLLTKSKLKRAYQTTKKVAGWSNVKLDKNMEHNLQELAESLNHCHYSKQTYNYLDLLRTPELRKRFLIAAYMCFTVAVCYYGILLNSYPLSGDKYINFLIGSALELISYVIVIVLLQRFGRKRILSSIAFIGGSSCIAGVTIIRLIAIYDLEYLRPVATTFVLVGRAAVCTGFGTIIFYMNELFPTVVRTMCNGACGLTMRSGSLLAPQMTIIGVYTDSSVPFILFGVLMLIGGALVLKLPETKGAQMPDTIDDVETADGMVHEKFTLHNCEKEETTA